MTWMQELPAFWEDAIDKHAGSGPWTRPLTSNLLLTTNSRALTSTLTLELSLAGDT